MESKFQFKRPRLIELNYSENDIQSEGKNNENLELKLVVDIDRIDSANEARVTLHLTCGGNNTFVSISAKEASEFRWDESLDENEVKALLNKNAPALLLSYLRPIISQITSSSRHGMIDIPFMDFRK